MNRAWPGRSRGSRWLAVSALLILGCVALLPARFGGSTTYVTTHGTSMQPRFQTGDLAVLHRTGSYQVGDVAGYHSATFHIVVLHRIVAIRDGRYTFKGDNNSWLDQDRPTPNQLIGALALRIPHGGTWLHRLTGPTELGLIAFVILTTGGGAAQTRRRRRRASMSSHASRKPRASRWTSGLTPQLRTAAGVTATAGLLGLALAAVAWTGPVHTTSTVKTSATRQMVFFYDASVRPTPAYDGTTVTSPDPVFRKLTETVDAHFAYTGAPGIVTVTAVLSTPGGWHSSIPLAAPTRVRGRTYTGAVRLDLNAFDARAQAAAAVTGLPASPVNIAVTTTIKTDTGKAFTPALNLSLTPLQLALTGDPAALTVSGSPAEVRPTIVPRELSLLGRHLETATARIVSAATLLGSLIAAAGLLLLARRAAPADEAAAICSRYAQLLVPVQPMPTPVSRPVIDVTTFTTLVRLAERYGLLILHWSRSGVATFLVQDDSSTFRYRTGDVSTPSAEADSSGPTATEPSIY